MPKVTFDTNIFISRKPTQLPDSFYFSVIVLQELVAGAEDDSAIKSFDAARREYEKAERLLVPNSEDWLLVGKVINSLQRGLKSRAQGVTPKMSVDEKYRIISDVLIARTARRAGVTVVTDNTKDFEKNKGIPAASGGVFQSSVTFVVKGFPCRQVFPKKSAPRSGSRSKLRGMNPKRFKSSATFAW